MTQMKLFKEQETLEGDFWLSPYSIDSYVINFGEDVVKGYLFAISDILNQLNLKVIHSSNTDEEIMDTNSPHIVSKNLKAFLADQHHMLSVLQEKGYIKLHEEKNIEYIVHPK